MRVFSFGGGVQSTAALVLAAQGRVDYRTFLFCNVGADSENPDTLEYVEEFSRPYALDNGIEFQELRRDRNNHETLLQQVLREERSVNIPVRMANGAPGNRNCTMNFKRAVIKKYLGAGDHVVGLGISLDEYQRMRTDSGYKNISNEYPLIDMRLTRADCLRLVKEAGLPQPPKSACWFCPLHNMEQWRGMRREKPDLFQMAVELENTINKKRAGMGKDNVYLSSKGKPLDVVIGEQPLLFELEDSCDSGYCMV